MAEKLRLARDEVHRSGGRLQVIAISTDPENDTPHSIHKFSRAHGLLHTWHYLTGTRSQLEPIWNSYHVFAAPVDAPAVVRDGHTSATFLLDGGGNERVLLGGNPDATVLIRDLSILAGVSSSDGAARGGIAIGERAPDFSLRSVAGNEVRLRSLRGHPVILNFWATWCPPCAKEIPALSALYHRLKGKGVVVVGVNKQEDSADVRSFVTGRHVTYPVLLDSNGTVAGRYQLQSLPTTYIIDARGTIQASRYGVLDNDWLHRSLTILPTES